MTTDDMKKHLGVYSRPESSIWQWRIKAPLDLAHLYPSQWAERISLGTGDLREANAKATSLHADLLAHFDAQRRCLANPSQFQQGIDAEVAKQPADRLYYDILSVDDEMRTESQPHRAYLDEIRKAVLWCSLKRCFGACRIRSISLQPRKKTAPRVEGYLHFRVA